MKVRALPPLQPLCERHKHVVLLWDERIEGRALLGVGAQRSILVDTPAQGIGRCGGLHSRVAIQIGMVVWMAWDTTSMKAWTSPPNQNACLTSPSASQRLASDALVGTGSRPRMGAWARNTRRGGLTQTRPGFGNHDVPGRGARANNTRFHSPHRQHGTPRPPVVSRRVQVQIQRKFIALQRGDIYEMNLCMPWSGAAPGDESWGMFERLAANTKAPHSAYVQAGPWRTLCASPERFLAKRGNTLHSQPIKGTVKRGATEAEDNALRDALANSEKEQAENVMIVDLVRNDLSRVAERQIQSTWMSCLAFTPLRRSTK